MTSEETYCRTLVDCAGDKASGVRTLPPHSHNPQVWIEFSDGFRFPVCVRNSRPNHKSGTPQNSEQHSLATHQPLNDPEDAK